MTGKEIRLSLPVGGLTDPSPFPSRLAEPNKLTTQLNTKPQPVLVKCFWLPKNLSERSFVK
jgi:hypothetical protein